MKTHLIFALCLIGLLFAGCQKPTGKFINTYADQNHEVDIYDEMIVVKYKNGVTEAAGGKWMPEKQAFKCSPDIRDMFNGSEWKINAKGNLDAVFLFNSDMPPKSQ